MSDEERAELRKEASIMALYVAVCLLAAMIALDDNAGQGHVRAFGRVWGTTIGLALAHAFAFRASARLSASGRFSAHEARVVGAQLAGALVVAAIASFPVVLFDATTEFDVARAVIAVLIGVMGYLIGRFGGARGFRSLGYAGAVLLFAVAVAVIKNVLSEH